MAELHSNFLKDETQYDASYRVWESLCNSLLATESDDWTPWQINQFEKDGNPIYAIISPRSKKAVRIIQVPPGQGWDSIRHWVDKVGDDLGDSIVVEELVIHCVLSDESINEAKRILLHWLNTSPPAYP